MGENERVVLRQCGVGGFRARLERPREVSAETFEKYDPPVPAPLAWYGFAQFVSALVAGFLLSFTFAFDDYLITTFVNGRGTSTIPLYVFGQIRRGVTPEINAIVIEKALERHFLITENRRLRDRLETRSRFQDMIGDSEPMQRV